MALVELVYVNGCPNLTAARSRLREVFECVGVRATWTEWDQTDDSVPERVLGLPCPSILVDGVDVPGAGEDLGPPCRADGLPSADKLVRMIDATA